MANFFEYSARLMPMLLQGLGVTLKIFILTLALALPLGLVISLMSISKFYPLKWIAKLYVWVLRGTPLMLQLFFIYYGLPYVGDFLGIPALNIRLDRFPAAVVAFILNYAAYFAEIYRGGIVSIDRGQYEASKALGFSYAQTMRKIIIPQTIRRIVPPISNETITLIKDTALVTSIGVAELLKAAKDSVNRDVNTAAFFLAAIMYLILTLVLTILFKHLESRFSRHERRAN